ncbi:unnamed protein product [Mytilus coruscus]|uniref:Uncharacterized protein n=1 Tax=Mytilus coruscus TaxID=42192 RepID=A0A6J8DL11_MYTCO|nr:unnamed protein product [Mytilus coruscus]
MKILATQTDQTRENNTSLKNVELTITTAIKLSLGQMVMNALNWTIVVDFQLSRMYNKGRIVSQSEYLSDHYPIKTIVTFPLKDKNEEEKTLLKEQGELIETNAQDDDKYHQHVKYEIQIINELVEDKNILPATSKDLQDAINSINKGTSPDI